MKLRNKKTGEIVIADVIHMVSGVQFDCGQSLAELNEEWEDVPEPKEYWYVSCAGEVLKAETEDDYDDGCHISGHKQIGNHLSTREEAERAVEKLKAYKRLKDKGFRFVDFDWKNGIIRFTELPIKAGEESDNFYEDLDLLFGGKE